MPDGYVQRIDMENDVPSQKWIDYSTSDYGVSLLNNGKYGFSIKEKKLSISVVLSPGGMYPICMKGTIFQICINNS